MCPIFKHSALNLHDLLLYSGNKNTTDESVNRVLTSWFTSNGRQGHIKRRTSVTFLQHCNAKQAKLFLNRETLLFAVYRWE